jgi:predicted DCC family thiol-disulfide oxidoreductase YuxK
VKNPKIILFDGVCNLCDSTIQKIIELDKKNIFKFASLQSGFGQNFLKKHQLDEEEFQSMILIDGENFYTKSDAALRIAKELAGIYSIAGFFLVVPKFIRNSVYDFIAKNRYKWFGKKESCWIPTPELQEKFIG